MPDESFKSWKPDGVDEENGDTIFIGPIGEQNQYDFPSNNTTKSKRVFSVQDFTSFKLPR